MKKNILISVYDMEIGGVERSLINMLSCFDYERYKVDLLVFSHQGEFMKLLPNTVTLLPENKRYTVFRKSMKQCLREGRLLTVMIRLLVKGLANAKAKWMKLDEGSGYIQLQLVSKYMSYLLPSISKHYDAAISFSWPHDFILNRVKAHTKMAWIHTDYSQLEIDNKIDGAMWNRYDGIASISEACTEAFLTQYPSLVNKISLIENIASPAFIRSMAEVKGVANELNGSTFTILSVGRLSFVKGFDMAIEAMHLLRNKGYKDMKWYIVGFGGSEAELTAMIEKYGLQTSVILLGKKENPYPYMKACDLYVQPSRYEGKAVTVTEAQIIGKPVLITNYPTSGSQVKDGIDGVICDLTPESIADEIEQLYKDSALRKQLTSNLQRMSFGNTSELEKLYDFIDDAKVERMGQGYDREETSKQQTEGKRHYSGL